MFKLAWFKFSEFFGILRQGHFKLLSFHLSGQGHIEGDSIPFFILGDIDLCHLLDFEARIVADFEPIFVLLVKLLVWLNLVDSVDLVPKLEWEGLLVWNVHVSVVHWVGFAEAKWVFQRAALRVYLALSLTLVCERGCVAQPADVLWDHSYVQTLALLTSSDFLVHAPRIDADGWGRYERSRVMVAVESKLYFGVWMRGCWLYVFMACEMTTHIGDGRATVCFWDNATTLDDVEALRGILDLTLQLQDLLIQSAASRLT